MVNFLLLVPYGNDVCYCSVFRMVHYQASRFADISALVLAKASPILDSHVVAVLVPVLHRTLCDLPALLLEYAAEQNLALDPIFAPEVPGPSVTGSS